MARTIVTLEVAMMERINEGLWQRIARYFSDKDMRKALAERRAAEPKTT